MRRRGILIVLIVIAAISLLINGANVLHSSCENVDEDIVDASQDDSSDIFVEYGGEGVCEVVVEFDTVSRSSTVTKTLRIVNNSDTPLVLVDYSTQCRCMWLEFSREPIPMSESTDVVLTFDSRGEWGNVGNYMEITTSNENAPIVLWIGAEIE